MVQKEELKSKSIKQYSRYCEDMGKADVDNNFQLYNKIVSNLRKFRKKYKNESFYADVLLELMKSDNPWISWVAASDSLINGSNIHFAKKTLRKISRNDNYGFVSVDAYLTLTSYKDGSLLDHSLKTVRQVVEKKKSIRIFFMGTISLFCFIIAFPLMKLSSAYYMKCMQLFSILNGIIACCFIVSLTLSFICLLSFSDSKKDRVSYIGLISAIVPIMYIIYSFVVFVNEW